MDTDENDDEAAPHPQVVKLFNRVRPHLGGNADLSAISDDAEVDQGGCAFFAYRGKTYQEAAPDGWPVIIEFDRSGDTFKRVLLWEDGPDPPSQERDPQFRRP